MNSHKIALITDSGCDIPDELLGSYAIDLVPLYIVWGTQELRDRVDINAQAFYERLVKDPIHPKTSQPSPQDFASAINRARQNGAEEAVIFTISSGMSSTHNAAQQAQRMVSHIPVHVVDTRANSMSQGWQVLAAARVREAGGDVRAMLEAAESVRKRLVTLLYVDTLEYLHKGGRIGTAARWIGTALNLKPQLYVDHQTGRIEPRARSRTRARALEDMYRYFFSQLDTTQALHVAILHGNTPDEATKLADRIKQVYAPVELMIGMTSPVMGIHTGPGAIGLCGYAEE